MALPSLKTPTAIGCIFKGSPEYNQDPTLPFTKYNKLVGYYLTRSTKLGCCVCAWKVFVGRGEVWWGRRAEVEGAKKRTAGFTAVCRPWCTILLIGPFYRNSKQLLELTEAKCWLFLVSRAGFIGLDFLIQTYGRSGPNGVALKCLHYSSELAKTLLCILTFF